MAKAGDRWRDARQAWDRLSHWHGDEHSDGAGALDALAELGVVRRLLDEAELDAVRAARQHRRSWAEIATRLGVTRQSAWEKWRDLDDEPAPPQSTGEQIRARAAADVLRRQSSTAVPNVVGMSWDDARRTLAGSGLVGVGADPDAPPPSDAADLVVTDQSPEPGARVPPGSPVRLWVERGGGSGVREPRVPRPMSRSGRAVRPEPGAEAVG